MDATENFLLTATSLPWAQALPTLIRFKTQYGPFKRLCVYSPNKPGSPFNKYYVPEDVAPLLLATPQAFYISCLNKKHNFVTQLPWVSIQLDRLPHITNALQVPGGKVEFSLGFNGEVRARKLGSSTQTSINIHPEISLSHEMEIDAKNATAGFIQNLVTDSKISMEDGSFCLGYSELGDLGKTSIQWEGNNFSGILTPKSNNLKFTYANFQIECEIGYRLTGKIEPDDVNPSASGLLLTDPVAALATKPDLYIPESWRNAFKKLGSLLVFTSDEEGAPIAPVAPIFIPAP